MKSWQLFPMQLHLFQEFPWNKWQYLEIQQNKTDHITALIYFTHEEESNNDSFKDQALVTLALHNVPFTELREVLAGGFKKNKMFQLESKALETMQLSVSFRGVLVYFTICPWSHCKTEVTAQVIKQNFYTSWYKF